VLATLDATWVVLGTGEPRYQRLWTDLAARHPDRIGAHIGFDEALAHRVEAGADMFLMPSRFEPCGLNQMYSLRYGTVPVVHGVGGLLDTVRTFAPDDLESTGFVFHEYTSEALFSTLELAIGVFGDRLRWRTLQLAGMKQDNSWHRSAREYVKLYVRAIRARALRA
jgi:starch synthase